MLSTLNCASTSDLDHTKQAVSKMFIKEAKIRSNNQLKSSDK